MVWHKLIYWNLSVVTTGSYMSKGSRDQWAGLYHSAIAEWSGTRGITGSRSEILYFSVGSQKICTVISLEKLQLCPTWLPFPRSKGWMCPVSGLSYRGHCKPTCETNEMLFHNIALTLNAGWRLLVCKHFSYLVPVCTVTNKNVMYSS